jgi:hypothetical protein
MKLILTLLSSLAHSITLLSGSAILYEHDVGCPSETWDVSRMEKRRSGEVGWFSGVLLGG